jgi:hypothetical protein
VSVKYGGKAELEAALQTNFENRVAALQAAAAEPPRASPAEFVNA